MTPRILFLPVMALMGVVSQTGAAPDFAKDIKPILEVRCVKCHGESKMEGELDLSYKEAALIGGEFGPAIVEGDPEGSVLMERIVLEKDHEEVMPSKGRLLTKEEIKKLREWIEAGAEWPEDLVLKEVKEKKAGEGKKEAQKGVSKGEEKK